MTDTLATGTGTASAGAGDPQGAGASPSPNVPGAGAPPPPAGAGAAANGAGAAAPGADAKWWDALPGLDGEDKKYLAGKNYDGPKTWVKSSKEADTKIASKGLIIPAENAPKAEWDAFYKAQGRPDNANAYEFTYPAPGYEPTPVDKKLQAKMASAFHEAGLNPKQAQRLNAAYNEVYTEVVKEAEAAIAAEGAAGEKAISDWEAGIRQQGGDPVKAKAIAQTAAQTIIPKDSPLYGQIEKALALDGKPGSGSAAMVDLFHRIGLVISENGGVLRPGGQGGLGPLTAPQAKIELDRMKADPNARKILADPGHPQYRATRDHWNSLIDTIGREEDAQKAAATSR